MGDIVLNCILDRISLFVLVGAIGSNGAPRSIHPFANPSLVIVLPFHLQHLPSPSWKLCRLVFVLKQSQLDVRLVFCVICKLKDERSLTELELNGAPLVERNAVAVKNQLGLPQVKGKGDISCQVIPPLAHECQRFFIKCHISKICIHPKFHMFFHYQVIRLVTLQSHATVHSVPCSLGYIGCVSMFFMCLPFLSISVTALEKSEFHDIHVR